eukprot:TRINITY_DN5568_c0_g2_i7.p1 TRINITY_DN5568_c0_g2~~TRINITY_DN5568_c0_g2_i7.p1  ORF type:complete len:611 (+),score=103.88 TRINITY_DN5568_c0_g2_i7:139-1971(+)
MGAGIVRKGVQKGAKMVGKGLEKGRRAVGQGPRSISRVLEKVQERLREQHWERQLIIQRDELVDIQIAHKLYENMPQHLRTNLWLAFLDRPELCEPLKNLYEVRIRETNAQGDMIKISSFRSALQASNSSENDDKKQRVDDQQYSQFLDQLWGVYQTVELDSVDASTEECEGVQGSTNGGLDPSKNGDNSGQNINQDLIDISGDVDGENNSDHDLIDISEDIEVLNVHDAQPQDPSNVQEWSERGVHVQNVNNTRNAENIVQTQAEGLNTGKEEQSDDWELVNEGEWNNRTGKYKLIPGGAKPFALPASEDELEQERKILNPLMEVVFLRPQQESQSQPIPPDSQYATLLQISIGQELVEEVISRDIKRTFPEVPQFELRDTQQALFNLLKAYALYDLETGYCQGMAFIAGLILMYLPEEPSFQLFCKLMDPKYGIGLRKYYSPDLQGLKDELEKFELLVRRYLPDLFLHMQDQGALAVLYAAPWFMTSYAACLPSTLAARIIDVLLIQRNDDILHQLGLAILWELQSELMELDSMEPICNYIKQDPGNWTTARFRKVFKKAQSYDVQDKSIEEQQIEEREGGIFQFEFQESIMDAMSGGIERAQSLVQR